MEPSVHQGKRFTFLSGKKEPSVCQGERLKFLSGKKEPSVCQGKRLKFLSGKKEPSVCQGKTALCSFQNKRNHMSVRVKEFSSFVWLKEPGFYQSKRVSQMNHVSVCQGKRSHISVRLRVRGSSVYKK